MKQSFLKTIMLPYGITMFLFLGTGFLSGSVVHFPLDPIFYTYIGLIGAVMFTLASYLQETIYEGRSFKNMKVLIFLLSTVLLSLGIGMISGGIQHFSSFPTYATVLIPLGAVLSFYAFIFKEERVLSLRQSSIIVVVSLGVGIGLWQTIVHMVLPQINTTHTHEHTQTTVPPTASSSGVVLQDGDTYPIRIAYTQHTIAGKNLTMLTYNGMFPGPELRLTQGSTVNIVVTNGADIPTTVHFHGVRLENAYDGVPDVTQAPIAPGASFTYKVHVPDAGAFWYHPHIREDMQQDMGLYGAIVVTPKEGQYYGSTMRQEVMFLDDIAPAKPYQKDVTDHALMGRFGDVLLTNGWQQWNGEAKAGETVRYMFINSANTRTFSVGFEGIPMQVVGSDGGRFVKSFMQDSLIIGPSERYVVEVTFPKEGAVKLIHQTPNALSELGVIQVRGIASIKQEHAFTVDNTEATLFADLFARYAQGEPAKHLQFALGTMPMMDHSMMHHTTGVPAKIEWEDTMGKQNEQATSDTTQWVLRDMETSKTNMDIQWRFSKGTFVKIRINNDAQSMHPMQHPFHVHGQRFVVLSTDGKVNEHPVWKDTVLVPTGATMDILVEMTNPGAWMMHCHIAEHLHSGMMLGFRVE